MVGSILVSGRRTGQVRLDLRGDSKSGVPIEALFVATNPKSTFEDICFDAQQKLDSIKASSSPVQSEIDFLETWLKLVLIEREGIVIEEKEVKEEVTSNVTPISGN